MAQSTNNNTIYGRWLPANKPSKSRVTQALRIIEHFVENGDEETYCHLSDIDHLTEDRKVKADSKCARCVMALFMDGLLTIRARPVK
jgi:hypothetical protein